MPTIMIELTRKKIGPRNYDLIRWLSLATCKDRQKANECICVDLARDMAMATDGRRLHGVDDINKGNPISPSEAYPFPLNRSGLWRVVKNNKDVMLMEYVQLEENEVVFPHIAAIKSREMFNSEEVETKKMITSLEGDETQAALLTGKCLSAVFLNEYFYGRGINRYTKKKRVNNRMPHRIKLTKSYQLNIESPDKRWGVIMTMRPTVAN